MKKYRLKKEVQKYFTIPTRESVQIEDEWHSQGVLMNALEEVEERVKVLLTSSNDRTFNSLNKKGGYWTEDERREIEFFLRVFGNLNELERVVEDYSLIFAKKEGVYSWARHIIDIAEEKNKDL